MRTVETPISDNPPIAETGSLLSATDAKPTVSAIASVNQEPPTAIEVTAPPATCKTPTGISIALSTIVRFRGSEGIFGEKRISLGSCGYLFINKSFILPYNIFVAIKCQVSENYGKTQSDCNYNPKNVNLFLMMEEPFHLNPEDWQIQDSLMHGAINPPYSLYKFIAPNTPKEKRGLYGRAAGAKFAFPGLDRAFTQHNVDARRADRNDFLGAFGGVFLDATSWSLLLKGLGTVLPHASLGQDALFGLSLISSRLVANIFEQQAITFAQRGWRRVVLRK